MHLFALLIWVSLAQRVSLLTYVLAASSGGLWGNNCTHMYRPFRGVPLIHIIHACKCLQPWAEHLLGLGPQTLYPSMVAAKAVRII